MEHLSQRQKLLISQIESSGPPFTFLMKNISFQCRNEQEIFELLGLSYEDEKEINVRMIYQGRFTGNAVIQTEHSEIAKQIVYADGECIRNRQVWLEFGQTQNRDNYRGRGQGRGQERGNFREKFNDEREGQTNYQSVRGSGRPRRGIRQFIDLRQIPYQHNEEQNELKKENTKFEEEQKELPKENLKIERAYKEEKKISELKPKETKNLEKKVENYSIETFINKINGDPDKAADFLLDNKRKMEQAELVDQFVAALKKSTKDIAQQAFDLLIAFNIHKVKAYISINLIKALSSVRFAKENLKNLLIENWKLVDPECLIHLSRAKFIEVSLEEVADHLFSIWNTNNYEKAVKMANDFELNSVLENKFSAISKLLSINLVDLVFYLVGKDINLAKKAITLMSTNKHSKEAAKLIDKLDIDIGEFPEIMTILKQNSMYYLMFVDSVGWYRLADIVSNDAESLGIMIKSFYDKYLRKKIDHYGVVAANLYNMYPEVTTQLNSSTIKGLEKIPYTPYNFPDRYAPLNNFSIKSPLPLESIQFIDTEEKVSQMVWTGNIVGLDSEWKPARVKFDKPKIALFQIGFENVVYLVDMIKLNHSLLLNNMLAELFSNETIVKLGINFVGDKGHFKNDYPHMTCFDIEFKNFVDLLDQYKKLFKENAGGLAGLCETILGRQICKGEQISNWERRPLRLSQIHYAALDASILISLYNEMNLNGVNAKKFEKVGKGCDNCGSKMHEQRSCRRGPKCHICQTLGHMERRCPYQQIYN